ncbi:LytR C-terminal domain-containing protein, partial [Georgenia sp. 10Sc9-8]|nr:LytR C-terminal domain-containing protein [Georgenia halotolerans]
EEPAEEEPAEEEPAEEEPAEEDGEVDFTASIAVLNGTGIGGLAGEVAQAIGAEGFSQVGASNYGAAAPETTTLYYNNASLAATAQAVGEAAGISNLQELPGATENVDIAIVLRNDYAG